MNLRFFLALEFRTIQTMNNYNENQLDMITTFGDRIINDIPELASKTNLTIDDIVNIFNTVILPKNNMKYKINKIKEEVGLKKCKRDECENPIANPRCTLCVEHRRKNVALQKIEEKVIKKCKHDGCDQGVATPKSLYCLEHKPKKVEKVIKKCKHDGCDQDVATIRSLYCIEHKPKKVEKVIKKCQRDGCDKDVPTTRSKYCLEHKGKRVVIPKFDIEEEKSD